MSDLFLIAHIVSGSPAFDIASHITCPECRGDLEDNCAECDGLGYWWIVPTSGHRAYPYWNEELEPILNARNGDGYYEGTILSAPSPWPDHYPTRASPTIASAGGLVAVLGLALRPSSLPIKRRTV